MLVIGGNGFLGYHIAKLLEDKSVNIGILIRPDDQMQVKYTHNPRIHRIDLTDATIEELKKILKDYDMVVFAAGIDDRFTPPKPALDFFRKNNVETTRKVLTAAAFVGVKRMVVLGSYFAYFARKWPEKRMDLHPYVKSRLEQEELADSPEAGGVRVVTLELPYIFGTMTGKTPLWKPLVKYIAKSRVVYYPSGGTTMIAVDDVAKAVYGALTVDTPRKTYVIGGKNIGWTDFIKLISKYSGQEDKRVVTLPNWLVKFGAWILSLKHLIQGRESGLKVVPFIDIQTAKTYVDETDAQKDLKYSPGDLYKAIEVTVKECLKE